MFPWRQKNCPGPIVSLLLSHKVLDLTCSPSLQRTTHPKVGLVSKEEFDSQRGGGEEGGKEAEEADGDMVFSLDLQENNSGVRDKADAPVKQMQALTVTETKRRLLLCLPTIDVYT